MDGGGDKGKGRNSSTPRRHDMRILQCLSGLNEFHGMGTPFDAAQYFNRCAECWHKMANG